MYLQFRLKSFCAGVIMTSSKVMTGKQQFSYDLLHNNMKGTRQCVFPPLCLQFWCVINRVKKMVIAENLSQGNNGIAILQFQVLNP